MPLFYSTCMLLTNTSSKIHQSSCCLCCALLMGNAMAHAHQNIRGWVTQTIMGTPSASVSSCLLQHRGWADASILGIQTGLVICMLIMYTHTSMLCTTYCSHALQMHQPCRGASTSFLTCQCNHSVIGSNTSWMGTHSSAYEDNGTLCFQDTQVILPAHVNCNDAHNCSTTPAFNPGDLCSGFLTLKIHFGI